MYFFYQEFENELENIFGMYLKNLQKKINGPKDSVHDSFATLPVFYYNMKSALRKSYQKVIKFSKDFSIDFIEMNINSLPKLTLEQKNKLRDELLISIKLGKFTLKDFENSIFFVDF
jgi:hypothetical protein